MLYEHLYSCRLLLVMILKMSELLLRLYSIATAKSVVVDMAPNSVPDTNSQKSVPV